MPNWDDMFSWTTPVPEVVLRATLLYLGLVVLIRVVGQRESGGLTVTDLLVVILVGEAVTHSMAKDHLSIPEGFIMAGTLLFWSVVLDALAYRSPRLARLLKARPRPLIEDGEVNQRSLRRELLSRDELDAQLRLHGVRDVAEVQRAYLEPNGMISVFTRDGREEEPVDPPPTVE
jgi:uncharacterized membrane protein YcaP (DUF421 family)